MRTSNSESKSFTKFILLLCKKPSHISIMRPDFVLLAAFIALCCSSILEGTKLTGKFNVVSGIFLTVVPPPIIYDTFIPVILGYKRSILNISSLSTSEILQHSCNYSGYEPNTPCPTAFYITEEVKRFLQYFNSTESNSDFPSKTYGDHWTWTSIEDNIRGFTSLRSTHSAVTAHIENTLSESPLLTNYVERNIEDFDQVNVTYIKNMMMGFDKEFWANVSAGRTDDAVLSNVISIFQTKIFQRYILEIMRWTQAVNDCKNYKIPINIISTEKLANVLNKIKANLTHEGYMLSIPETNLSDYYQTLLTSCVATEQSFFVTIRIPVKSLEFQDPQNFQYFKDQSVPFYFPSKHSTTSEHRGICFIHLGGMIYVRNVKTGRVTTTACNSHQLCGRSKRFNGIEGECIRSVLDVDGHEISSHCYVSCEPGDEFPYISYLDNNTVAIAGRKREVLLKCHDKPDERIPLAEIGAVILKLPKYCRIVTDEKARPVTKVKAGIVPSILVHWTEDKNIGTYPNVKLWEHKHREQNQKLADRTSGGEHFAFTAVLAIIVIVIIFVVTHLSISLRKIKADIAAGRSAGSFYLSVQNEQDYSPSDGRRLISRQGED